MTRYLELSIKEINEKLKNKEIKPIDLVNECFERIKQNEKYNAFITLNEENAIKKAKELESKEVDNILFAIPIMATASQNDNITQSAVQTLVSNFVNTAAREGKITQSNYNDFIQELYATGNSYQVDLEVQTLADNPGKKGAAGESIQVIGESIYYSEFTNTIENEIKTNGVKKLKQGDYVLARVQNTNVTMGTKIKNFLYTIVGKDTIAIEASASALVSTTGK